MPFRIDPRLASARLRGLLQQLVDEKGTQRAAARAIGMKPNVFGKTLNSKRSDKEPSGTWYLAAFAKLGLPIDYFLAEGADTLDYREFLRTRGLTPPTLTPADLASVAEQLHELRDEVRRLRAADGAEESGMRSRVRPPK